MALNVDCLKKMILMKGFTQGDVAREAEYMSLSYLSNILNGVVRPSRMATNRILNALGKLGFSVSEIKKVSVHSK